MIREWIEAITGKRLQEAAQSMHNSNRYHREEIARMLEAARATREEREAELERLEQAISVEELTGTDGDD